MDWSVPREALTDGASSVTVAAVDIKRNASAPLWSGWAGPRPSRRRRTPGSRTPAGDGAGLELAVPRQAPIAPGARRECAATGGVVRGACHVASRLRHCA